MPRARPRRRRRNRNFVAIPFVQQLALVTLSDGAVLSAAVMTLGEDLFVISADCTFSLRDATATEGPITAGFAHGDLSDAEISEHLSANLTDPDDIIARERARRPVRKFGSFPGILSEETLNHGVPIRRPFKFSIGDGHTFDMWAYNQSGAALAGGTFLEAIGTLYGNWQR